VLGRPLHVFGSQLERDAGLIAGELLLRLPELLGQVVDRLLLAFGELSKADGDEGSFDGVEGPRAVGIPEASKPVEDLRQLTREEGHPSARYAAADAGGTQSPWWSDPGSAHLRSGTTPPDTHLDGLAAGHRPARPTGRLILAALAPLRLIPAGHGRPATIPQPSRLQTRLLGLLDVDPTQPP
jgi:hypothetical protein